uniref:Uncharacterized protein n=1 Tax=Panagrolaimus sp. PS1159 TaxID=55785 RepID=A0AC35FEQ8_9BILA
MATKDNYSLPFKNKQNILNDGIANGQYKNLILNQNREFSSNAFSESLKNVLKEKVLDYDFVKKDDSKAKKDFYLWKKSTKDLSSNFANDNDFRKKDGLKKGQNPNINNSTLSLHISAYENSVETKECLNQNDLSKNREKQLFVNSTSVIKNLFEFPRQQKSEEAKMPEVSQFKASRQLINPNQTS